MLINPATSIYDLHCTAVTNACNVVPWRSKEAPSGD